MYLLPQYIHFYYSIFRKKTQWGNGEKTDESKKRGRMHGQRRRGFLIDSAAAL